MPEKRVWRNVFLNGDHPIFKQPRHNSSTANFINFLFMQCLMLDALCALINTTFGNGMQIAIM